MTFDRTPRAASIGSLRALGVIAVTMLAAACGEDGDAATASNDDAISAASFPAFKGQVALAMPQLKMAPGNHVLKNERIVTVTFAGDDSKNVATIEAFADAIGTSDYWKQTTSEYGVGPATSNPSLHVHVKANDLPPATKGRTRDESGAFSEQLGVLDDDVISFAFKHATDPSSGWPPPTDSTVYVLYVPAKMNLVSRISTTPGLLDRASACEAASGFHDSKAQSGSKPPFLYALVYEGCGDIGIATNTASHEMAEAATDPFPDGDETGVTSFDDDHTAWNIFNWQQEENGDACEFYPDSNQRPKSGFPFAVQSLWSNAQAKLGHNPCVPTNGDPYFNVAPFDMVEVSVVVAPALSATTDTKGFKVPKNQNGASFTLGFFSDADTGTPWNVSAKVGGDARSIIGPPEGIHLPHPVAPSTEQRVKISFGDGKTSTFQGKNGDKVKVNLDIDRNATPGDGASRNGIVVTFVSEKSGMAKHYMPVMIALE